MPGHFQRRTVLYWQAAVLVLLLGYLYAPLTFRLARQWWNDPNYAYGFFVSAFSLFLLWESRAKLGALPKKPRWSGLIILLVGLATMILGAISSEFFLTRLSVLLLICGMLVFLAGWDHLAAISFPLAFLILMIPSSTVVTQITLPLQLLASKAASFLLATCGVSAIREGNIIVLPFARLEVAEACSGVRSLFSLITLTVIYGHLAQEKIAVRGLLVLMAFPTAIVANALRIALTGLMVEFWGVESAGGTVHLVSGWLIFAGSLLLIFLFHRLTQVLFRDRPHAGQQEEYA